MPLNTLSYTDPLLGFFTPRHAPFPRWVGFLNGAILPAVHAVPADGMLALQHYGC